MLNHARIASVIVTLVHLAHLGGCKTFDGYPDRRENVAAQLAQLDRYYADDVLTRFYFTLAEQPSAQQAWRDEVVYGRLRAIDLQYTAFVQNATGGRIAYNALTDIAVLGLSAAGALVPSAGAASTLAAISGGFVGMRGIVDKEVFYDKTLPALLQTMDAQRRVQLARIRARLAAGPAEYPLLAALADVEDYYQAGTFPAALVALNQAAGDRAAIANAEIMRLCTVPFSPAVSDTNKAKRETRSPQTQQQDPH